MITPHALIPCLSLGLLLPVFSGCQESAAATGERSVPTHAICVLQPVGDSEVHGTLYLQRDGETIHITGEVKGLTPGLHGFHVHQYGDVSNMKDGTSAGSHFAPRGRPHGRPGDEQRHVGDLGNIMADDNGTATIDIKDHVIAFSGTDSILGRAFVVHAGEDEFTQPTGDAGSRVALGVIGIDDGSEE